MRRQALALLLAALFVGGCAPLPPSEPPTACVLAEAEAALDAAGVEDPDVLSCALGFEVAYVDDITAWCDEGDMACFVYVPRFGRVIILPAYTGKPELATQYHPGLVRHEVLHALGSCLGDSDPDHRSPMFDHVRYEMWAGPCWR